MHLSTIGVKNDHIDLKSFKTMKLANTRVIPPMVPRSVFEKREMRNKMIDMPYSHYKTNFPNTIYA